jgi:transglutaminase-like putative cysteine protease
MQLSDFPVARTPTTSRLYDLASGKAGIIQTLKLMKELVRQGKSDMVIRQLALRLISELPQKSWRGEILAVFEFVQEEIRYVHDINGIETLHTARKVLEMGAGDCDDKAILLASLLESIGHPTRFIAIGFAPDDYEHVLVDTKLGPHWLPLDATEPNAAGWYPPGVVARLIIKN